MKKLNRTAALLFGALFAVPLTGYAESWSCKHDNHVREIEIQHETSEALPCSVVYRKPTEGVEEQTLWSASSDANYCEEKARGLVEKHQGWGWACEQAGAEAGTEMSETSNEADSSATAESAPAEATNEATEATGASDASDASSTEDNSASSTATAPEAQSMP